MIRACGKVTAWHDGIAIVLIETKTPCNNCISYKWCNKNTLISPLKLENVCTIQIASKKPLKPGQLIEIGIRDSSLLNLAFLVYIIPLVWLFLLAGIFQMLLQTDIAIACGTLLGGTGGFIIFVKSISSRFSNYKTFQPIILNIIPFPNTLKI